MAVRWYLRYGLSYRDVEELLAERGITVDHGTVYRWVQTFTPEFVDAARPARHPTVTGSSSTRPTSRSPAAGPICIARSTSTARSSTYSLPGAAMPAAAARAFFAAALSYGPVPSEITTDRAPVYPRVLTEVLPAARHLREQYPNNVVETDHGRLKARLRPMRGVKRIRSLRVIAAGHAFVQNLRRGHYELAVDTPARNRVHLAFDELAPRV